MRDAIVSIVSVAPMAISFASPVPIERLKVPRGPRAVARVATLNACGSVRCCFASASTTRGCRTG